jgi:nodulation protein E
VSRVLVTGLGVAANIGHSLDEFWSNLAAGRPNFSVPASAPDAPILVGAVDDDALQRDFPLSWPTALDRSGVLAVAAAGRALADAGLNRPLDDAERVGVVIGNGGGGLESTEIQYRRLLLEKKKLHPLTVARVMTGSTASAVSMAFGAKGPCFVTSSACASSAHAIGVAAYLIRAGVADVVIAGGAEAGLNLTTLLAWQAMKIVSRGACRPFAKGRDGLTLSEGGAALILESQEHARARGAPADVELVGFGASADAGDLFHPSTDGMARAMRAALADGGLAAEDIDYLNAHGTGTRSNDTAETEAIKSVFGAEKAPPFSSTKSVTGHALGAAGAIEAVATVLAIRHGAAPPTANYDEPDPACDLDCVPNVARPLKIRAALSTSFAFGGLNAALAFRRLDGASA